MCQLLPKKPDIEKTKPKSQTTFLTPTASKKQNLRNLASKKAIWQPCSTEMQKYKTVFAALC